jgi:group II intron reverse transcriptase/maturase
VQRAFLNVLEPVFEEDFLPQSYGYRRGKSVQQVAEEILDYRDQGLEWVVDADITRFFDSIDHERLMQFVAQKVQDNSVLRLIYGWLTAGIFKRVRIERQALGTVQGAVISPLLSNIYLHEFDNALLERGSKLLRFADDFVILCHSREKAEEALAFAKEVLAQLGLELNEAKTRIVHFSEGFNFLGQHFDSARDAAQRRRRRKMQATLYITEQGSLLYKKRQRLVVLKDDFYEGDLDDEPAVLLTEEARRKFLAAYEKRVRTNLNTYCPMRRSPTGGPSIFRYGSSLPAWRIPIFSTIQCLCDDVRGLLRHNQ